MKMLNLTRIFYFSCIVCFVVLIGTSCSKSVSFSIDYFSENSFDDSSNLDLSGSFFAKNIRNDGTKEKIIILKIADNKFRLLRFDDRNYTTENFFTADISFAKTEIFYLGRIDDISGNQKGILYFVSRIQNNGKKFEIAVVEMQGLSDLISNAISNGQLKGRVTKNPAGSSLEKIEISSNFQEFSDFLRVNKVEIQERIDNSINRLEFERE